MTTQERQAALMTSPLASAIAYQPKVWRQKSTTH